MKMNAKLPKHFNGLEPIEPDLINNPKDIRVAIVLIKVESIVTDVDTSMREPKLLIQRIEPLFGADKELATEMYHRVHDERTGAHAIPFDKERDVKLNGTSGQDSIFTNAD